MLDDASPATVRIPGGAESHEATRERNKPKESPYGESIPDQRQHSGVVNTEILSEPMATYSRQHFQRRDGHALTDEL